MLANRKRLADHCGVVRISNAYDNCVANSFQLAGLRRFARSLQSPNEPCGPIAVWPGSFSPHMILVRSGLRCSIRLFQTRPQFWFEQDGCIFAGFALALEDR